MSCELGRNGRGAISEWLICLLDWEGMKEELLADD